jgi:LysM repeat protein
LIKPATRPSPVIILALAFILTGACSLAGGDDDQAGVTGVTAAVRFSTEVGPDGVPVNPRNLFPANVREITATVLLEGVEPGMAVEGVWYQLGTANAGREGQEIRRGSPVILDEATAANGRAAITLTLSSGSGVPEDTWLLRIFVDDSLVKTAGFVVNRGASAVAAPSPTSASAPPPASSSPAAGPTPVTYTVVSGDSMTSIAQRYLPPGENIASFTARLAQFNNLSANGTLSPGQILRIPPAQ